MTFKASDLKRLEKDMATTTKPIVEVQMTKTRETKNTFRFDAPDEDATIQNVYINKSAFPGAAAPERITVTIF